MHAGHTFVLTDRLIYWLNLLPSGAAGLLSLADLQATSTNAVLTGTSTLLDTFVICPGIHNQQESPGLSKGEYPACAAMTTGYAFRVENEATVFQLQRLGRPGHLTTLQVSAGKGRDSAIFGSHLDTQLLAVAMTVMSGAVLIALADYHALVALMILLFVRAVNVIIFRRRSKMGWKGAPEPGVQGDLIVLLSQDRWIRIRGLVDDIKAVTSGQWLRDMSSLESLLVSSCKLLLYFNAALMWEASKPGQWMLLILLLVSTALLGLDNEYTNVFQMYGRSIRALGQPNSYNRRLDLAKELITQTGRSDWAVRLGMIQPESSDLKQESELGPKIM